MLTFTLAEVKSSTYKARDAWWTVFLVDPLAGRLVVQVANRTSITPNQITWGAFLLGIGSAGCYLMAEWAWLAAGALLYHLSFVLDCMDGKIARLKGTGTILGGWLDYIFDRIRVFLCTLALMWGQYQATGQGLFLILGLTVVFLDMLRYVDALQVAKVRRQMRSRLRKAMAESALADLSAPQFSGATETKSRTSRPAPDLPAQTPTHVDETADLQREFRNRFTRYMHLRDWLRRHRIRTHLVSGIEFQMAVFIIGPLTHHIAPVTIGTAALLLVFEGAITYKLWLSTRDLARALGQITPGPVGQTVAPQP